MPERTYLWLPEGVNVKDISDGHHSFDDLYEHRNTLMLALMTAMPDKSWWSYNHHPEDDEMFPGCVIAGIETPAGPILYHLKANEFEHILIDLKVIRREYAPKWDGIDARVTPFRLLRLARDLAQELDDA